MFLFPSLDHMDIGQHLFAHSQTITKAILPHFVHDEDSRKTKKKNAEEEEEEECCTVPLPSSGQNLQVFSPNLQATVIRADREPLVNPNIEYFERKGKNQELRLKG